MKIHAHILIAHLNLIHSLRIVCNQFDCDGKEFDAMYENNHIDKDIMKYTERFQKLINVHLLMYK